jgi:adenosylcobinamide-phosphate synthase
MILNLVIAFLLDVLLGDPQWFPHPVRGIGLLITRFEALTRKHINSEFTAGMVTVLATLSITLFLVWMTILLAGVVHPWLERIVIIGWMYLGLSARDLADSVALVHHNLAAGDLETSRQSVSRIVGRETKYLDESEVSRAAVESVAENSVDGIVSPLFFAAIGGPVLLWLFKAVSTCDSMIGYRNEQYRSFGTFGARLDDVLNFVPARLCYLLFPLAALLRGESPANAWTIARRDASAHPSPNAGIPEAAMAGALGIRLGSTDKGIGPFGKDFRKPQREDIKRAVAIMWTVSGLALIVGLTTAAICF